MKKRSLPMLLMLCAALLFGSVAAAGGDAGDPLISLAYLEQVFAPRAEQAAQERIDADGGAVYGAAAARWNAAVQAVEAALGDGSGGGSASATWTEALLKQGDVVSGVTGAQLLLLSGGVSVQFSSGAVVDVTDGTELASGAAVQPRHRCLTAEDTTALFVVTSRTAVVDYCGGCQIAASAYAPDYNAMASALKRLSLFRGTDTGYGQGFDLEKVPTRIQALIMLIRMLGEERAALACEAAAPFGDIPESYWGRPYVAYAYQMGYTNGVEGNLFAPDRPASAGMYVEFILRALGYSDTTQTDVGTSAERAMAAGVITSGELGALQRNEFLRADVAYLSWYALEALLPGGMQTLHEKLEADGVFSPTDYEEARLLVTSPRM